MAPPQLEDFFLSRPQPGGDRECIEMLAKAAGFSIKDLEEKQRKGEVKREAFLNS